MYLAKKGFEVCPTHKDYLLILTEDLLSALSTTTSREVSLCTPAIDWVAYILGHKSPKGLMEQVIESNIEQLERHSEVLRAIIEYFPASHVSARAKSLCGILDRFTRPAEFVRLFSTLGKTMKLYPPKPEDKHMVLETIWTHIQQTPKTHIQLYLQAADNIVELLLLHYSTNEVNTLLQDIVKHVREHDHHSPQIAGPLVDIFMKLIKHTKSFTDLLQIEWLLPFLDLFSIKIKTELCEKILDTYTKAQLTVDIQDPVIIHSFFAILRSVSESLDTSFHSSDFLTRMSTLICQFLRRVTPT